MFRGREIRTKLPKTECEPIQDDEEVRDRDKTKKQLNKEYADKRRHSELSELSLGDKVLVTQPKLNKLTTPFSPKEHTVTWKKGNSVVAGKKKN